MNEFPRMQRLPPYAFEVIGSLRRKLRQQQIDIIDFAMGNPDVPTPQHIVDKLVEAAQKPVNHRYSVSRGIPNLRRAVCDWYKRKYDVDLDPETEAVVAMGSKEGLSHLCLAMLQPGEVVFAPDPTYPIHVYAPVICGADVRRIPISSDRDFFEDLLTATKQTWPKPKLLILSFPHNPTTLLATPEFFQKVVDFAKEHEIRVIHDLAYADLVFDGYKAPSFLQAKGAKDVGVEFYSMTKGYSMAGWRVGFCLGNPEMVHALTRIKSYLDYGIFQPIQIAATVGMNTSDEIVRSISDIYEKRRNFLCEGMNRIGWPIEPPKATMFCWAKIPEHMRHLGSMEFAKLLMTEGHVAVQPGIGFGSNGDDYVRIALIENEQRMRQALKGMKKVIQG